MKPSSINKSDSSTKKRRIFRLSRRARIVLVSVIVVCLGVVMYFLFSNNEVPTEPSHQTVLPENADIEQLGGWSLVSPPNSKTPVFAYTDEIDGVAISVSQQELPDSFKGDEAQKLAELAKEYSATSEITSADTRVYIGTSSKGPQSVLLIKNSLLVMIKSQDKISDSSWKSYVASLGQSAP